MPLITKATQFRCIGRQNEQGTFVTCGLKRVGLRWARCSPQSSFSLSSSSALVRRSSVEASRDEPGKAHAVKLLLGPADEKSLSITVRPLYLDTKLKEYTTGPTHDVTDRMFVVRRAYRVNDSLPSEPTSQPRWLWQRGGWLLVDRNTGRITQIKLPDFDPYYSEVSWYRDYAAYCGVADDGERVSGSRRPDHDSQAALQEAA